MIRRFQPGDQEELSTFIGDIFDRYIAGDYSSEGIVTFYDFIKPENILKRMEAGNICFVYHVLGRLAGMIEIRDLKHISLFFVGETYQAMGIGRQLLEYARSVVRIKTDRFTVNAAPYSVAIYRKLGFEAADEEQEKNGIRYTPMVYYFGQ